MSLEETNVIPLKKVVTIGLLWHSLNSGNLGVGALTVGHMRLIRDLCQELDIIPHFLVICWTDDRPFYCMEQNTEVHQLRLKDFIRPKFGLFSTFRRCDLILDIGAGDSFSDIYGSSRILKMLLAQNLALFSNRPLILSPQTIGPFSSWYVRLLALSVMNRAEAIATRDSFSAEFARSIGCVGKIVEATDVALRLPFVKSEKNCSKTKIGINVSGLLMGGGYTRDNMFQLKCNYPVLIRRVVEYFVSQPSCEVHLIGHVLTMAGVENDPSLPDKMRVEDDRSASMIIADEFDGVIVAPLFKNPSSAKSYISNMDFMLGARMHACIAALSCGVPVLPMAYSRKFAGMFGTLGYKRIADCMNQTDDEIMAKIEEAYSNLDLLKEEVTRANKMGLERLKSYESLLAQCLLRIIR
ncbi:MAG: polysaccharide pyruvyl transferase family protein [Alphaproteobacteria bacterium]